jgi:hypothetical protein
MVKHVGWSVILGLAAMGCNALVGNDGQYVAKETTTPEISRGHSTTDLVSAGDVGQSKNYKMVFSVGQTSITQDKATSSSHSLQGGLVCTDGR